MSIRPTSTGMPPAIAMLMGSGATAQSTGSNSGLPLPADFSPGSGPGFDPTLTSGFANNLTSDNYINSLMNLVNTLSTMFLNLFSGGNNGATGQGATGTTTADGKGSGATSQSVKKPAKTTTPKKTKKPAKSTKAPKKATKTTTPKKTTPTKPATKPATGQAATGPTIPTPPAYDPTLGPAFNPTFDGSFSSNLTTDTYLNLILNDVNQTQQLILGGFSATA